MAGNHLLLINSLPTYFKDYMKQFKRGEVAYKDCYAPTFQADLEQNIVFDEVKPSMKRLG